MITGAQAVVERIAVVHVVIDRNFLAPVVYKGT